jgi:hypothetical protein
MRGERSDDKGELIARLAALTPFVRLTEEICSAG